MRPDHPNLPRIPETLDEAVDMFVAAMSERDKAAAHGEDPAAPYSSSHHWGGMTLRNEWGLWYNATPIARWFADHGIGHADDRSACVFKAVHCRLTGRAFDIAAEAESYRQYWASKGCNPDGSPLSS